MVHHPKLVQRPPYVAIVPRYAWFTMKVNMNWMDSALIHTSTQMVIPLLPSAPSAQYRIYYMKNTNWLLFSELVQHGQNLSYEPLRLNVSFL